MPADTPTVFVRTVCTLHFRYRLVRGAKNIAGTALTPSSCYERTVECQDYRAESTSPPQEFLARWGGSADSLHGDVQRSLDIRSIFPQHTSNSGKTTFPTSPDLGCPGILLN